MSRKTPSQEKEKTSNPPENIPVARLEGFHVLQSARVRAIMSWIPGLLMLLVIADWLVGAGTFSRDVFRMTGVLTVALVVLAIQVLFESVPQVLETILRRELIEQVPEGSETPFNEYLNQFQAALRSRVQWIAAGLCAAGGLFATYPLQYYMQAHQFPYGWSGMVLYYFGGQAAVVDPVLGLIIGLLAWRVGVIAYFIGLIGERFNLKIQPSHSDRCGGFRPVGNLGFNLAAIILIPSIFLAVWGFITTFFKDPALQIYVALWGGLFRQMLVLLACLSLFIFFQPLYKIHLGMEKNAETIRAELDGLSSEIEKLSYTLRSQAVTVSPQEGEETLKSIEFMKKVYGENSQIPTWPFDWKTVLSFSSAQVVPILSLVGTSGPVVDLVKGILLQSAK